MRSIRILFQSSYSEAATGENDGSPATKKRHIDTESECQEESSLWLSFDSMIQTGEETDAASSESYSSAEVNVEKYLKEPNQPKALLLTGRKRKSCIQF